MKFAHFSCRELKHLLNSDIAMKILTHVLKENDSFYRVCAGLRKKSHQKALEMRKKEVEKLSKLDVVDVHNCMPLCMNYYPFKGAGAK